MGARNRGGPGRNVCPRHLTNSCLREHGRGDNGRGKDAFCKDRAVSTTTHQRPANLEAAAAHLLSDPQHCARLATAVEQASDGIIVTDTDGTIRYVNPAFERMTGYARAEAIGANPRILNSGENDPAVHENLWETLSRGEIWKGQLINRRKDGTLCHVEATISPVFGQNGAVLNYAAVTRDITQEVQLEARMRQAEKMEAIGQLASGVAHDFNNVLTAILTNVELLMEKLSAHSEACSATEEEVRQIENAARQGESLTTQLLSFSRGELVRLVTLDTRPVLKDAETMLRMLISGPIAFEMDVAESLHPISGDAGQLKQVLINLTVNARDAMPNGGLLAIRAANVTLDELYVSGHTRACVGPHVKLTVRDTGCGMDAAARKHLFEPFYTTKPPGKGTGLGLATAYAIINRFGGHVTVTSAPGEGTVFEIYFPAVLEKIPARPAGSLRDTSLRGTETVLVCEDDAAIRDLECEILSNHGYTVLCAQDGAQAIQQMEACRGKIDLLITDVLLPGMDGGALADKLCAARPDLRILFVSGSTDNPEITLGGNGSGSRRCFLAKPFNAHGFLRRVRDVLSDTAADGSCAAAARAPRSLQPVVE